MEQRISLITLGVADLQRAVVFYERVVGWRAESTPPGVVFFDLNGVVLKRPSGVDTPGIFPTRTDIRGRSPTTHFGQSRRTGACR